MASSITVTASTDDTALNCNDVVDTWSAIVTTKNASAVSTATDTTYVIKTARDSDSPNTYTDSRVFLYFDTSSLPDSCLITGGTLHLHQTANVTNGHGAYISPIAIVKGTFSTGAYAVADFQKITKTVNYGTQAIGAGAQDYNITLDPSLLQPVTNVSRTGNTFMAIVPNADVTATTPNESASATDTTVTFSSANNATAADRPQLTITYIARSSLPVYL